VGQSDEDVQRGAERGGPARISQAGKGLSLCRQGNASEGVQAAKREAAWQGRGERQVAEGDQMVEGVEEPLAAGGAWQPADLLERGEDFTWGNNHKGIKLLALGGGQIAGEQAPEAFVGRSRTRATSRSSTLMPGRSTFSTRSQLTARSKSRLGRSLPSQARVKSQPAKRQPRWE
jgi:hypothetical protein